MGIGLIFFTAWIVFMAITVIAFIAWFFHEGQHKNIEEAKYRMLEDHEPESWPGRASPAINEKIPQKPIRKE
jgi:cbb3-type cytochrome oxidase subunit 3